MLEFDRDILRYRSQPERMQLFINGERRHHIPDFGVEYRDHFGFIEVKWEDDLKRPGVLEMLDAAREASHRRGLTYEVWTNQFIRAQPRFTNVATFLRHLSRDPDIPLRSAVIDIVSQKPMALAAVLDRLGGNCTYDAVVGFIASGHLVVDMAQPFTRESVMSAPAEGL